jgi:hypothetical protein
MAVSRQQQSGKCSQTRCDDATPVWRRIMQHLRGFACARLPAPTICEHTTNIQNFVNHRYASRDHDSTDDTTVDKVQ